MVGALGRFLHMLWITSVHQLSLHSVLSSHQFGSPWIWTCPRSPWSSHLWGGANLSISLAGWPVRWGVKFSKVLDNFPCWTWHDTLGHPWDLTGRIAYSRKWIHKSVFYLSIGFSHKSFISSKQLYRISFDWWTGSMALKRLKITVLTCYVTFCLYMQMLLLSGTKTHWGYLVLTIA